MNNFFVSNITSLVVILSVFACTSNPLDNNEQVKGDKVTVTGSLLLSDGASPEGAFVWLKNYDIGTHANENGEFKITLPAELRNGTGTVQRDTLYFYIANYFIERAYVNIIEGEFQYLSGDLDANGRLRNPIMMKRFMTITTTVIPPQLSLTDSGTVVVKVKMQAENGCGIVTNNFVGAQDPRREIGDTTALELGAVLIKNLETNQLYIVRTPRVDLGPERLVPCDYDPIFRKLEFVPANISMAPGKYEMIPYLWLNPNNVPIALLEKLGRHVDELNANYLQKPIKRLGGFFELQN